MKRDPKVRVNLSLAPRTKEFLTCRPGKGSQLIDRLVLVAQVMDWSTPDDVDAWLVEQARCTTVFSEEVTAADWTLAKRLIAALCDPDPCSYDHHGLCQAHSLHPRPCPHEQAQALLANRGG
jgi:hypothetical protein